MQKIEEAYEIFFNDFKTLEEEPPEEFEPYILIIDINGDLDVMFALYDENQDSFFDGIGAHLDKKYVVKYQKVSNWRMKRDSVKINNK